MWVKQLKPRGAISRANSPFGDPRGYKVVDSLLADIANVLRCVLETPFPNHVEFVLKSHCGHSHLVGCARSISGCRRHDASAETQVRHILARHEGALPSRIADIDLRGSHDLSFATSSSKDLRRRETAKIDEEPQLHWQKRLVGMNNMNRCWFRFELLEDEGQLSLRDWADDLIRQYVCYTYSRDRGVYRRFCGIDLQSA